MTDPNEEPQKPNINAENNSNAVGSISAGGDISGNIYIGNVYQTPEDDLPLSSDEIQNGLTRFAQYLPERAPVLQDSFSSIAKRLRATLGADQNSLSPTLKKQREEALDVMKPMCMEVTDISFRAICLGQNPPPYDSRPPFLGLFAFRPEDREFFFGRDALVQKLVARIKAHTFLAVLGASGSGKSSLVMAGLVPALEAQMSYLTPSSAPLSQLLTAKESASTKTVFVIDQFEELFTHPHDATERADFIHALLELTKTNRVVITMRADFWGEVAIYTDLKQAMQEYQELIAPMTVDELHSAMEKQAAVVGLRFDPTLSDSILAEVKGEPGAMPLLQHALWELWNRRHGLWIKAGEYQAFGGVKQAIASTAEEVYASCSDFEQDRVRDIFLRLTRLDESGEGRDTRRRVLIEELIPINSDSSVTINLLNKLADARLIVKTDADVEVAHEALIRHWSRLTEWLNEDRENLRLREGVSESAREWENSNRDDSLLNHRSGRLELALAMSKLPRYQLNPIEQGYLNACVEVRERDKTVAAQRRRYAILGISAALIVIIAILVGWGWTSNRNSSQLGFQVATANAAKATAIGEANSRATAQAQAEEQSYIALGRQLAIQAQAIFTSRSSEQQNAVLLAIQSMQIYPSIDAATILQTNSLARPIITKYYGSIGSITFSPNGEFILSTGCSEPVSEGTCITDSAWAWKVADGKEVVKIKYESSISSATFSPDGAYIVSGGCDKEDNSSCIQASTRIWKADTGQEIARISHDTWVGKPIISPDGKYIASSSIEDGVVRVWSINPWREIFSKKFTGFVFSVAFSPDSQYIAIGGNVQPLYSGTGRVSILETTSGKETATMQPDYLVISVAFSPDGQLLASGGRGNIVQIWDVPSGQKIHELAHNNEIYSVMFSTDGKYLITGSLDGTARTWEVSTGNEVTRMIHDGGVYSVALSPNNQFVVSGSADGTARLWETTTGQELARMTHNGNVSAVAFSPDSQYVASGSNDGIIYVWKAKQEQRISYMVHDDWVSSFDFSPDGKYVVSGGCDNRSDPTTCTTGSARIWETSNGQELARIVQPNHVSSVAFGPDGNHIALGTNDGIACAAEITAGKENVCIDHKVRIASVVFSLDGKYVTSVSDDGLFQVWDAHSGEKIAIMNHHFDPYVIAFSPNRKYVALGESNTITVWKILTNEKVAEMAHSSSVSSVAFSPDGQIIASGGEGSLSIWKSNSGQKINTITYEGIVNSLTFSPNGKYLVGNYGGTAYNWQIATNPNGNTRVWEIDNGIEITSVQYNGYASSVAYSPDGNYLALGICLKANALDDCNQFQTQIWDITLGREIANISHNTDVKSVSFSPNGEYVGSISDDGVASTWKWKPEDLIADACSRINRNLTRTEWNQYIGNALPYRAICPNLPIEPESTPTP